MASLTRLSWGCRRLGFGWMATMATALPRGENCALRLSFSASNNTWGGIRSAALESLQSLAFRLQEPKPLRAPQLPTAADHSTSSKNKRKRELVAELCEGYHSLAPLKLPLAEDCERGSILLFLASVCSPTDSDRVVKAIKSCMETPAEGSLNDVSSRINATSLSNLRQATTPPYEEVLEFILKQNAVKGMEFLVSLRGDLLRLRRWMQSTANDDERSSQLKELDAHLRRVFSIWFSPGMLVSERITYEDTSASIIEIIATKEAVHPMKSLDDLRSRLGPGRRVFALFHPLLPGKPLTFVHVALKEEISSSMSQIMDMATIAEPKVATFYSISNSQPGLAGVGLGEHLLKQAIERLQVEFPSIEAFVTLSPMPRFHKWLVDKLRQNEQNGHFYDGSIISEEDLLLLTESGLLRGEPVWKGLLNLLETFDMNDHADEEELSVVRSIFMKLATRYLVLEKHRGKPLDGVTRFHISNGAELHRVNFAADVSRKGLLNSFGMMVNYRYDLDNVQDNQKGFEADYRIPASPDVLKWLPVTGGTPTNSKL